LYRNCSIANDESPIRCIERDIRDVTDDDLRGFDAVIHLAGLSNDPLGNLDPRLTYDINYRATVELAARAKAVGVRRFLQASTCSIYGASDDQWLTESSPFNPVTPYGQAKAEVEADLQELADERFSPTLLRFATAYGVSPRLRGDLVVNNLVGYAIATGQILLKSDGRAWRPIVHIEDISRALLAVLNAPRERVHNEAFNVGDTAENHLVRDIAEQIGRALPRAEITFADGAEPDRRNYRVNCDKLVNVLPDARPRWTLAAGIQQLIDVYSEIGLTRKQLEGSQLQRLKRVRELQLMSRLSPDLRWNQSETTLRKAA
jgi:nucleoside-diphosphate-sugar epimerase